MNEKQDPDTLMEFFEDISVTGQYYEDQYADLAEDDNIAAFLNLTDEEIDDVEAESQDFEVDEEIFHELFDSNADLEIPAIGFNWAALFWGVLLLLAVVGFVFNEYRNNSDREQLLTTQYSALKLKSDIESLGNVVIKAAQEGTEGAFSSLSSVRNSIDEELGTMLSSAKAANFSREGTLSAIESDWEGLDSKVQQVLDDQVATVAAAGNIAEISGAVPDLLDQTDSLISRLLRSEVSLELLNLGNQMRYLLERIKSNTSIYTEGSSGWRQSLSQLDQDIKRYGLIKDDVLSRSGGNLTTILAKIEEPYQQVEFSNDSLISKNQTITLVRQAADEVSEQSVNTVGLLQQLIDSIGSVSRDENPLWAQRIPIAIALFALLCVLCLISAVRRHNRKREHINTLVSQHSEDAVIKLLDEMGSLAQGDLTVEAEVTNEVTGAIADSVNYAVGEMRVLVNGIKSASNEMVAVTEDTEQLIAQLLTSNDMQSDEIRSSASDVENMSQTMNLMSESATKSSERARVTAESAKRGAEAVRNTIVGMNASRSQIQDTSKRLKRLGESSQQINEIVNLIKDVTEQTNVLSLNASIQAAMAGEAGRGFAVVAEEVQRLADRSARASSEITELVKNIQQDVNSAIASMESTTEEVISGAKVADEAGQTLDDIENISQDLYEVIQQVAEQANGESVVANRLASRMNTLNSATKESDMSVSQVASSLGQIREVAGKLNKSVSGFQLPS